VHYMAILSQDCSKVYLHLVKNRSSLLHDVTCRAEAGPGLTRVYVSLVITMERKTSWIQSSLMPCARSTRRPYRALPQDSRSVST